MRKWILAAIFIALIPALGWAQTRRNLSGWCEQGGQSVTTDGRPSTTKVQRSYPSCTVTVYDVGTTYLATIASDSGGTPKANPFTAGTDGRWDFWAVQGQYDVQFSGSGLTTFTRGGLWITTPAAGGTGDVVGPSSSTDNALARFDLTTGKLLQNSTIIVSDTGNVTGLGTLNTHTLPGGTDTIALLTATQSLTNKTLGTGTTFTLSSDATGDLYYRNAGGVLARLGIGLTGQCLGVTAGPPAWVACGSASSIAAGSNTQVQFNNSGSLGADPGFTYSASTDALSLGTSASQTGSLNLFNSANSFATILQPGTPAACVTLTLPTVTDTLLGRTTTDVLTNKTLTSSTNTLGGVTMVLGSDSTGDLYYRNSGGLLTRLGIGTAGQVLTIASGLPSWAAPGASLPVVDTTSVVEGSSDNTKELRFEVDGFTTGTVRVLTPQNANYTLAGTNLAQTFTSDQTLQVASATALTIGPNGATNPVVKVTTNVASSATGIDVTGRAAGAGVDIFVTSSGTDETLSIIPKGTGKVRIPSDGSTGGLGLGTGPFQTATVLHSTASTTRQFLFNNSSIGTDITDGTYLSADTGGNFNLVNQETGQLRIATDGTTRLNIDSVGNIIIGGASDVAGASAVRTIAVKSGTSPTTFPADTGQAYVADAAAGAAEWYFLNEAGERARATGLAARVTSQFDKTDTTLANITGLSRNVEAGYVYGFEAKLFVDASAVGGTKYAIGGTATATSITYQVILSDNSTNANTIVSRQTALGGAGVGQAGTTAGFCLIKGTIVVNAAGTLVPMFAQNATNGTSSVLVNSTFKLTSN